MGKYTQYVAMTTGVLWLLNTGINLGWSSPYLPVLQSDASPVGRITSGAAFWCSVMPLVGAVPGALVAGALVDRVGRRTILLALTPVAFACFVAVAFARELWVLDAARFLLGSSEGATYTALPMYFGEIAEPRVRGALSASIIVGAVGGLLLINLLARCMSICASALVAAAIPLTNFCLFVWLPKSPYYLIKAGRLEEAKANLARLRAPDDKLDVEFDEIQAAVRRQEAAVRNAAWTDLFTQPANRRAIAIYVVVVGCNKFSGSNPMMFYTDAIFAEAGGVLSAESSATLFHFVGFLAVSFAACTMDKFGRRPLVMISAVGCGCNLALMAAYLTLKQAVDEDLTWIPLVAMISYYAIFNLGLCIGPVVFLSELFPTSVKGYALGMADSTSVVFGTIAAKLFHWLAEACGMHAAFWCFCAMCFVGAGLIFVVVPETKGKTLEQIQLELAGACKDKQCEVA